MTDSVVQPSPEFGMTFDLDGTRIDSVYQHVLAWQQALTGRLVGPMTQSGA